MNLATVLLHVLAALPGLVHGAEEIWRGFPGQGQVKKQAVLSGVGAILSAAAGAGVSVPAEAILTVVGGAIDAYVAIANRAGAFDRGPVTGP